MDIKNILNVMLPPQLRSKDNVTKSLKSGSTTDRDANGQMPQGGNGEPEHGPMSDEQFKRAVEHLKTLAIVTEHGLMVEVIEANGKRIVLIKEPDGKVVRRIQEEELWSLKDTSSKEKGQLLRKMA